MYNGSYILIILIYKLELLVRVVAGDAGGQVGGRGHLLQLALALLVRILYTYHVYIYVYMCIYIYI